MTQVHFTEPYNADGRLKVLWLDDKSQKNEMLISELSDRVAESKRYTPWLAITSITNLDDLEAVKDCAQVGSSTHEYDVPQAPYDVYILDFRLCDDREHCPSPTRELHDSNGMHVPAVGLLTGLLTTLHWPSHPQAVIPYSGYIEEMRAVWNLCWRFRPAGLHMAEPTKFNKDRQDFGDLLTEMVASNYRIALRDAFAAGKAAIGDGQREELLEAIDDADGFLGAETKVEIQTAFGSRAFKLGALFFDMKERRDGVAVVPSEAVLRELLDAAPIDDPIAKRANEFAEFFWSLRATEDSREGYEAIVRGEQPVLPYRVQWLGSPFWQGGRGRTVKDKARVVRLAVIMLFLCEKKLRGMVSPLVEDDKVVGMLEYAGRMTHADYDPRALLEFCAHHEEAEEALRMAVAARIKAKEIGLGQVTDLLTLRQPITQLDFLKLLDPLPLPIGQDKYATTLGTENRVGAGLQTLLDGNAVGDPSKTIDLGALVMSSACDVGSMLLPSELVALRRFASRMFRDEEMPAWLSLGRKW